MFASHSNLELGLMFCQHPRGLTHKARVWMLGLNPGFGGVRTSPTIERDYYRQRFSHCGESRYPLLAARSGSELDRCFLFLGS